MPASSSNFMQLKSNGHTPRKNVVATGLLQVWICSSILTCVGTATSASDSAHTQSIATVANNSSTVTDTTLALTTPNTSAPSTSNTSAPSTSNTSAPSTPNTSAPSKSNTSSPTTPNTSDPSTSNTSAPSTPNTSAPTSNTSDPSTSNTSAPSTSNTSSPTTPNTSDPSTSNTSDPSTSNTSSPTTPNTSDPSTSNTSGPSTSNTSDPSTSNTSDPSTSNTSAPSTPNTSAPSTSNTSAPSTPNTSDSSTSNTSDPSTSNTSDPSTPNTSTASTSNTSAPSTPNTSTASTSNTSAPRAESTTRHAGGNKPTAFPIPTETMDVTLKLQVKLDREFNKSLEQPDSDYYKTLVQTVTDELTPSFNHSGFLNITVTGFWPGSIGVNFTSYYKDANISDLHNVLLTRVSSMHPKDYNLTFLEQSLNDSIYNEMKEVCEKSSRCPQDYYCSVSRGLQQMQPSCQHICLQYDCQNNGYCVAGTRNQPVCKCPEDDDFIYSGENCEMKVEKLSMSKDKIIGIAAGVGGGVILLLIFAIIVISLRQRRMRRPKIDNIVDNASEQSFQSFKGSEDATHQPVSNIGHGAAAGNIQSLYRLPEEIAENPNFNPYLSLPSTQQGPAVRQRDFSQGYTSAVERPRERSRNVPVKLKQFHERVPNYGEPVQIPRLHMNSYGSGYVTTDNKHTQSSVPKTTNTRRENQHGIQTHSPAGVQVYDYSNDMELMASRAVHPLSDTDLYDFTYETQNNDYARDRNNRHPFDFPYEDNTRQRNGIKDPYSIKRPLV